MVHSRLRLKKSREERDLDRLEDEDSASHRLKEKKRKRRKENSNEDKIQDDIKIRGPSRHPTALFGDDLLRAERYEASMKEERNWSAKLNELLDDDVQGGFSEFGGGGGGGVGGGDDAAWEEEMMRLRGDQFDGEIQQKIPKRWTDAAQGFESRIGRGSAGLKEMDEEEYAEYIREGMHRRKNAKEIAFEEERKRKWEEAQKSKQEAREEKRLAEKEKQEKAKKEQSAQTLKLARSEWETRWQEMMAKEGKQCRCYADLPWPNLPGSELNKESVTYFLSHESEKQEASKRIRSALLRYHPDRFLSSRHYAGMEEEMEREKAREGVLKVSKILSDIISERRTT